MNSFVSPAGRALCLRKWMARLSAWKTRCWCHGLPAPSRRWRHSTYHVLEEAVEAVVAAAGGVSCTRFDRDRAAHRSAVAHRLSSSAARVGGGARARRVNCVAAWACAWRCARASRELRGGAGLQEQRRAQLNSQPQTLCGARGLKTLRRKERGSFNLMNSLIEVNLPLGSLINILPTVNFLYRQLENRLLTLSLH